MEWRDLTNCNMREPALLHLLRNRVTFGYIRLHFLDFIAANQRGAVWLIHRIYNLKVFTLPLLLPLPTIWEVEILSLPRR